MKSLMRRRRAEVDMVCECLSSQCRIQRVCERRGCWVLADLLVQAFRTDGVDTASGGCSVFESVLLSPAGVVTGDSDHVTARRCSGRANNDVKQIRSSSEQRDAFGDWRCYETVRYRNPQPACAAHPRPIGLHARSHPILYVTSVYSGRPKPNFTSHEISPSTLRACPRSRPSLRRG